MNLGQSQFQDTFFVAGAQLTPFRQLRQIELELRQLDDSIKRANFAERRLKLKIAKLNPDIDEDVIDIEEAEWDLENQIELLKDAEARRENFSLMKTQLLERVPQEYWDQGFENAELDHWTKHVAKQIGMSKAMGLPPPQTTMEMLLQLPESAQYNVFLLSNVDASKIIQMDQQAFAKITNEA